MAGNLSHLPHEANEEHDHDEVGGVGDAGFVLVQTARHKHLDAANEGGGKHLNST